MYNPFSTLNTSDWKYEYGAKFWDKNMVIKDSNATCSNVPSLVHASLLYFKKKN